MVKSHSSLSALYSLIMECGQSVQHALQFQATGSSVATFFRCGDLLWQTVNITFVPQMVCVLLRRPPAMCRHFHCFRASVTEGVKYNELSLFCPHLFTAIFPHVHMDHFYATLFLSHICRPLTLLTQQ